MKTFLFSPGPTPVPQDVMLKMAEPFAHHRTPEFEAIFKETIELTQKVLLTNNSIALLSSSGTGAMEASVANLAEDGKKALCINGGKFGERWGLLARAYGFEVIEIEVEWGKSVEASRVAEYIKNDPDITAVFATHSETSTGTETDIAALGEITKDSQAVLVVDAISSAGACELRTDDWNIDVLCVGSQKGLMLPPGLAIVAASERAKARMQDAPKKGVFYFNLPKAFAASEKNTTPFTPPITLIIGLNAALKRVINEGVENLFARHKMLARAVREACLALGLELLSSSPSTSVTAIKLPEGLDGAGLVKRLRDVEGITFAGGQNELKGKIARIGSMGYMGKYDMIIAISALEMALAEAGVDVELGKGVRAAEEVFLGK